MMNMDRSETNARLTEQRWVILSMKTAWLYVYPPAVANSTALHVLDHGFSYTLLPNAGIYSRPRYDGSRVLDDKKVH